jgi:hypothetical protein
MGGRRRRRAGALLIVLAACGGDDDAAQPDSGPAEGYDAGSGSAGTLEIETVFGFETRPAAFVAARDGDEGWRVLESVDGRYSTRIESGHYAGVVVCESDIGVSLYVFHATISERTTWTRRCEVGGAFTDVRVDVEGLEEGEGATVMVGSHGQFADWLTPTAFIERRIEPGLRDVFAIGRDPARISAVRDVDVLADGQTTVTVDLADGPLLGPKDHALTVMSDVDARGAVEYVTRRGTRVGVGSTQAGGFDALPAGLAADGDMYFAHAGTEAFDPAPERWVWAWLREPQDLVIDIPAPFDDVTVGASPAGSDHVRPAFEGSYPDAGVYEVHFKQDVADRFVQVIASRAALGDEPWTMPDLAGVPGWDDSWSLRQGETIEWSAFARVVTGPGSVLAQTDLIAGTQDHQNSIPVEWDGRRESYAEARGFLDP